jgi:hypothetical protein
MRRHPGRLPTRDGGPLCDLSDPLPAQVHVTVPPTASRRRRGIVFEAVSEQMIPFLYGAQPRCNAAPERLDGARGTVRSLLCE